ncbi:hypothetical protein ACVIGB_000379 [Bradyrhizobium sp. USDA 4341]
MTFLFSRSCTSAVVVALLAIAACQGATAAEPFAGPSFKKGRWHFVRTMDLVVSERLKQRLYTRELTACVDPTVAMKGTFSSPSIGKCVSAKPEKLGNTYKFSNRCDVLGPVSTTITVTSDEAYTELNELKTGALPRAELVVANRMGDCQDPERDARSAALSR